MAQEIIVRRAKVSDAGKIVAFVSQAWQGRLKITEETVIERFGNVGFLLAERGERVVGMLAWGVENLVVRVIDLLIWPASERAGAVQALFAEMEQAAAALQCEAVLLLPPRPISPSAFPFFEKLGYTPQVVARLPKAWREAAAEARLGDDDSVLLKQLREDRVLRPM